MHGLKHFAVYAAQIDPGYSPIKDLFEKTAGRCPSFMENLYIVQIFYPETRSIDAVGKSMS